jgi:hypothetical protein
LTRGLPEELLDKRVLMGPLFGIESGPRSWSAEMVLEHLIEVGSTLAALVIALSHGEEPNLATDITATELAGGKGARILRDYEEFLDDYDKTLLEDIGDRRSRATHPHPSLGELTAHRWHCLAAIHQTLHRRQMEQIVAELNAAKPR